MPCHSSSSERRAAHDNCHSVLSEWRVHTFGSTPVDRTDAHARVMPLRLGRAEWTCVRTPQRPCRTVSARSATAPRGLSSVVVCSRATLFRPSGVLARISLPTLLAVVAQNSLNLRRGFGVPSVLSHGRTTLTKRIFVLPHPRRPRKHGRWRHRARRGTGVE